MEIKIILAEEPSVEGIIFLKSFIDKASIDGLEETEIDRTVHAEGQMGAGMLLNSITAIIHAAEKPLIELVKCLQKYVDNYSTMITIPTKDGNIEIKHGRSMAPEDLKKLVVAIQNNSE